MFHVDTLVKYFQLEFYIIFILLGKRIRCDDCQAIEPLSFGSDIDIKCNQTHFRFLEQNPDGFHWEFSNQSVHCRQRGILQSAVNECGVKQINSKYLRVPVKSTLRYELACIYCLIDYKPIAPVIYVEQSNDYGSGTYTFSLTATGLEENESFEILWARRVHIDHSHSINYWFYQKCYHEDVELRERSPHSIVFSVLDASVKRVEFIIRRCRASCVKTRSCSSNEIGDESNRNYFRTPDALEKIVCDEDCLTGLLPSTTPPSLPPTTTTAAATSVSTSSTEKATRFSSTIQLSHQKQTMKALILYPLAGLFIVLLFIILGCVIISRMKGSRSDHAYRKTSHINLDDNKETIQ